MIEILIMVRRNNEIGIKPVMVEQVQKMEQITIRVQDPGLEVEPVLVIIKEAEETKQTITN